MIGRLGRDVRRSGGDWLSRLERAVHIREVTGSNPVSPTTPASPARSGSRLAIASALIAVLAGCAVAPAPAGSPTPVPGTPAATRSGSPTITPAGSASTPGRSPAVGIPDFGHIFVIVMENEESRSIIGNAAAPYLNSLARSYGLATNDTAIGHPSEPNYIALVAGSPSGVTDDGNHDLAAPNLFDQVEASGRTWQVAAQNYPGGCYLRSSASGGPDGPGTYVRKHNPAISFVSISRDPARCARIGNFHGFDPAGASFSWIEPNLCNTMHDCSIGTGDAWLASFLPAILASAAYRQDGLVLLTFDEGSTSIGGGGKVATIVISPLGRAGFVSNVAHDHYSLLRTIQVAWGLPCLAHSCQANDLVEFFR